MTAPIKKALDSLVLSRIRTWVPMAVGALLTVAIKRGFDAAWLNEAEVTAWLIPLCSAAYYDVARRLEKRWVNFGWLLGSTQQPVYIDPKLNVAKVEAVIELVTPPAANLWPSAEDYAVKGG